MSEDKKIQKRYYLDPQWHEYIESHGNNSSIALETILKQHKEYSNNMFDLRFITNQIKLELLQEIDNGIKKNVEVEMKRIRLGTNNTDRNTQVLIELLQGFMVASNKDTITTTDLYKPDFLVEAETVVHERIANLKQKKHSKGDGKE
ncbi:hypothetical protein RRU94_02445 [Domibacillus sp. DTU_2020_1001157_1_SI_ALB_TIR_016]|uniref:hypothetical protein n=1 Tax=Domibacillus sp. DTU_2020_1001157_1_SI_ALB_TIR_016 TaxID=3077789 RepID=UPI0028E211CF|nr:hypothetical protein [Domibacillus sp. DTU_2020_1001157_1_SI_ALB_TIR_016]WNS78824.1 hypothetical protein RRU94_02445 [Domibacillus sp. DTU_2020_1001157_1_SI_ALB_TIR_016]